MENKDLEMAMYRWFEMKYQLYDKMEGRFFIYLYYEGDECAHVHIDKKNKQILFKYHIWNEFLEIFPVKYNDFERVMSKWIKNTFDLNGDTLTFFTVYSDFALMIPEQKK